MSWPQQGTFCHALCMILIGGLFWSRSAVGFDIFSWQFSFIVLSPVPCSLILFLKILHKIDHLWVLHAECKICGDKMEKYFPRWAHVLDSGRTISPYLITLLALATCFINWAGNLFPCMADNLTRLVLNTGLRWECIDILNNMDLHEWCFTFFENELSLEVHLQWPEDIYISMGECKKDVTPVR